MSIYERLSENVVARLARLDPTQREILLAALLLLTLMFGGTAGYVALEGWYWLDALYMTIITLTTIGFGEVRPLSEAGRVFTIFIALIGIGNVAFIATRAVQLLLATQRLRERHMRRQIKRMKDHSILCGYGRVGKRIVQDLQRDDRDLVVIERSQDELANLQEKDIAHVAGDAEDEDVLRAAGVERARALILTLPEDSANVFVTLMAREVNPDIFILARTNNHKNRRKIIHAGADKVIAPDEIGADRMAQVILRPNVDQFMEQVLRTGALGLLVDEVRVKEGSPLAGKSLAESNFRQQFDAMVVAILDADSGEMMFNPSPHTSINVDDILIVLGSDAMIERLRTEGCAAES